MDSQKADLHIGGRLQATLRIFFTVVRIMVGWHFLYEGLSKLLAPNWTCAGYLMSANWLFADLFHWIAANEAVLRLVDLLNMWGLVLIGLGLMTGFLTRLASISGAILILLYYMANPPLIGYMGEATGEGRYLLINKNSIEWALLAMFIFIPKQLFYGLDRLLLRFNAVASTSIPQDLRKRSTLKDLVGLPLLGALALGVYKKQRWESFEERHLVSNPSRTDAVTGASPRGISFASLKELKKPVPKGKIGDLEVSRLMCGGNLISGYAHSRDLLYVSSLVQSYFTDEKVMETLFLCEACGINAAMIRVDVNTLRVLRTYRHRGGKMNWFAQCKISDQDLRSDIDAAVDCGAVAAYVHGGICDDMVATGKLDSLAEALEHIKSRGVLAGLGAHSLQVPIAAERAGLDPDFYMKTLNSGNYWTAGPKLPKPGNWTPDPHRVVEPELVDPGRDNIWSLTPLQTIEYMKTVRKPWIAYKVLGAGAIPAKEGFEFAFENGADFICVGMFDFQVVADAKLCSEIVQNVQARERIRPWIAS